jgi:dihydroorotase-like cyclic amidohydrolase
MIQRLIRQFRAESKTGFEYHYKSRPPVTEIETVAKLILFAKETGTRVSFAHISTPEAAELVKRAKMDGMDVYLETCPHYLFLTEETVDRYGPYAKGNPPLRSRKSVEKLWEYVNDGSVDFLGSDHGPFLASEKEKGMTDIFTAAAGSACIELTLPLMLTAVRDGKLTMKRLMELVCENPARIFGLWPRKGALRVGGDADCTVVDMENEFSVDNREFVTKSRGTSPQYNGFRLVGRPIHTVVRGRIVMKDRRIDESAEGWGRVLRPEWPSETL